MIRYQWSTDQADWKEWDDEKPAALGTYFLRAVPPNFDDYAYSPESEDPIRFRIVKGLGGSFTDYVEIEIAGYEGGTASSSRRATPSASSTNARPRTASTWRSRTRRATTSSPTR